MPGQIYRLRAALRDLVALSTIPAAWVGREPPAIAAGLADVLMDCVYLDFAFVRLNDADGKVAAEVTRGDAGKPVLEWLEHRLDNAGKDLRKEFIPNVGGDGSGYGVLVFPIGVGGFGGVVAAGCRRSDFPSETDQMLISVAANQAATVFMSARLFHERHRAEEELREARAQEALRKARSDLALVARRTTLAAMSAGLAHELSQPLTAIIANAKAGVRWLTRSPPDIEEGRGMFGHILAAGQRATEVIESVRAMVSPVDQPQSIVDMNELIRETVALAHGDAQAANVLIRLALAAELPAISAHRVQLQQVILNLVNNGIDAMRSIEDRVRELHIESKLLESSGVAITVRDSGKGIEPDHIDRIFDAFFTTKANGLGIGLSICRAIIEAHGGKLSAAAAEPHGAIFQIVLPNRPGAVPS
jgi:C4-dicarboxylate-specific signal transduction histidine kinase